MVIVVSHIRISHHLPGIVDTVSIAPAPTQSAQVSHPHAIRTSDESMGIASNSARASHYLSGIVDAGGTNAPPPNQISQVNCRPAVKVNKEGSMGLAVWAFA